MVLAERLELPSYGLQIRCTAKLCYASIYANMGNCIKCINTPNTPNTVQSPIVRFNHLHFQDFHKAVLDELD